MKFSIAAMTPMGGELFNPLVMGPLAAFVFIAFVREIIVPGRTYRRVVDENKRLSEAHDKVLTVAQSMVDAARANTAAMEDVVATLENVVETLAEARSLKAEHYDPEKRIG